MVRAVVERNSYDGIRALFEQTLAADDPQSAPAALAARVRCPALALGGAEDRLAPPAEVEALGQALRGRHRIFDGAGHTIPIEAATAWREAVVQFLDARDD
jgi:pimeloyl-ACP methyl ester carboxylesterase